MQNYVSLLLVCNYKRRIVQNSQIIITHYTYIMNHVLLLLFMVINAIII